MAPIRRYLRITKYSVLECRIYLDNPALAQSWLLNPRDPVLPRVIEAVRPLVLPKLEEEKERERNRRKGGKKRSIKDVVTKDEFEVAIFLTETNTRHSLLYKQKHFRDKTQSKLTSNSSKLVGASSEAPINVDDAELFGGEARDGSIPGLRREGSEENDLITLENIPSADEAPMAEDAEPLARRRKRGRHLRNDQQAAGEDGDRDAGRPIEVDDSEDELFVSNDGDLASDRDYGSDVQQPLSKRRKEEKECDSVDGMEVEAAQGDDKKKMAMDISYDGFAIYGRVLCLVVKRRGVGTRGGRPGGLAAMGKTSQAERASQCQLGGQASMENWITSTQLPIEAADDFGVM